jgi:GTP-binding protein HflX
VSLPHGARIILSDTVGFISDLPTMLIAAFRATLEEVIEADVILHVHDVSHEDAAAQSHDVEDVLRELGIEPNDKRIVEIWNKIDRLMPEQRMELANKAERQPGERSPVLVSAVTGEGMDRLRSAIESGIGASRVVRELLLDPSDGAGVSWLHRHTEVLAKAMDDDGKLKVTVRAEPAVMVRVNAKFAS